MMYRATCTIGSVLSVGQTIGKDKATSVFGDVARLIELGALVEADAASLDGEQSQTNFEENVQQPAQSVDYGLDDLSDGVDVVETESVQQSKPAMQSQQKKPTDGQRGRPRKHN